MNALDVLPASADPRTRPRRGASAQSLLNTIIGEFVYPRERAAWTHGLVSALALFGIDEAAARQALARSAGAGLLEREQVGRRVRWRMSRATLRIREGEGNRVYTFRSGRRDWDGRWLLLSVIVPDDRRRLLLRRRLAWAGFGMLPNGLAISPHVEREAEARRILELLGLENGSLSFVAEMRTPEAAARMTRSAWNLDDLVGRYERFLELAGKQRPRGGAELFTAVTRLVHEWRRFIYVDPGLPLALLPRSWVGVTAKKTFDRCYTKWRPGAARWFDGVNGER
jgi:phenylacetic acid degradation operon negative regulatory protein